MTKNYFLSILFILLGICSPKYLPAQIDSLQQVLKTITEDSLKIKTHFKLYRALLYNDPEGAKKSIDEAFEIAKNINDSTSVILCYDKWGGLEMNNANYPKAIEYYSIADSLLQDFHWPREQAVIYGNFSGLYKDMDLYDKALEYNEKFMEIAKQLDNVTFLGYGNTVRGDIYYLKAQYNLAIKHHLEALRHYEIGGDSFRIADGYLKLGEVHLAIERYDVSKKHLKSAAELYKKLNDQAYYAEAFITLGIIAIEEKEYQLARNYYQTIDSVADVLDRTYLKAHVHRGHEEIAFGLKDYSSALAYNTSAQKDFLKINDQNNVARQYISKAAILHKLGKNNQALIANKKADKICEEFGFARSSEEVLDNYYNIYKAQNKFEDALSYHEDSRALFDSIHNNESKSQIEELQIIYNVEKQEQELILVQKENDLLTSKAEIEGLKKQRLQWSLIGLAILASIVILWQYQSYLKNKRIQVEKEKIQKVELEAQKMEKQQLERELTGQMLQLCKKNELLTTIKNQVSDIMKTDKEISKSELKSVERNINFDLQNEETWSQFLLTFSKVHPDFITRLRTKADKLSSAEQRMACLIRMNLSSKQMTAILNISHEGIKKARYRLRKKLNLESGVDLVEYIAAA